jgi:hypothetical protein
MNKHRYKILVLVVVAMASMTLAGCGKQSDKPAVQEEAAPVSEVKKTIVTDENYAQAESEIIFAGYVQRIAAATGTNGMGVWLHLREGADPKDRTIMRINFDTLYSFAIVDLTEDAVLTMPETNGRYQSAWFITDEHYNPMAFIEPGTYTLTQEDMGSRYVMVGMRTQVNVADPADLAIVHEIQDQLILEQKDTGEYSPSADWDMEEVLAMRAKYEALGKAERLTSEQMFGKKGEVPLKEHNAGAAMGWGGLTAERAVYPTIFSKSAEPQTLTLKDVPAGAFWSVTVYDAEGFPQGDVYNINSAFAVPEDDGSVIIHFGGDKGAVNYMDIFDIWEVSLRIYEPTEAYFNGEWVMPELELVQ